MMLQLVCPRELSLGVRTLSTTIYNLFLLIGEKNNTGSFFEERKTKNKAVTFFITKIDIMNFNLISFPSLLICPVVAVAFSSLLLCRFASSIRYSNGRLT